jgi:hypothetical protein
MPTNDDPESPPPTRAQSRALAVARRAEKAMRREAVLNLVVSGYVRELIAEKLGVSVATVRREVDRAIGQRRLDAPDRYVRLQVTRLNKALLVVDHALAHGDIRAVEPLVRLCRRARPLSRAGGRRRDRRKRCRAAPPRPRPDAARADPCRAGAGVGRSGGPGSCRKRCLTL